MYMKNVHAFSIINYRSIRMYTSYFVGCLENQFHIALNSLTSSESCQNCPANSISPGGFASYCTCVEGYGRKMSMSLSSDCEGVYVFSKYHEKSNAPFAMPTLYKSL